MQMECDRAVGARSLTSDCIPFSTMWLSGEIMTTRGIVASVEKLGVIKTPDQPPIVICKDRAKDTEAKVRHLELAGRRVFSLDGKARADRITSSEHSDTGFNL